MQYIVYGFTSVLTSSAAATAVLHYAAALNESTLSDVVEVPAVDLAGSVTTCRFALGPGIPLLTEEAADDVLEDGHQAFVDDITARIGLIRQGQHPSR